MRTYITRLLFVIFLVLKSNFISGQPPCKKLLGNYINNTNIIIKNAQESADSGKVHNGDLIKSVYHQNLAKKMFEENNYEKAVQHSYRSRQLAFKVIKANNGKVIKDTTFFKENYYRAKYMPSKNLLDKRIQIPIGESDKSVLNVKQENVKIE